MSEATFFARFGHLIVLGEEMDLRFSLDSVCVSVQMRPSVRRRRYRLTRHLPQTTRQTWVGKSHNFPLFPFRQTARVHFRANPLLARQIQDVFHSF